MKRRIYFINGKRELLWKILKLFKINTDYLNCHLKGFTKKNKKTSHMKLKIDRN